MRPRFCVTSVEHFIRPLDLFQSDLLNPSKCSTSLLMIDKLIVRRYNDKKLDKNMFISGCPQTGKLEGCQTEKQARHLLQDSAYSTWYGA